MKFSYQWLCEMVPGLDINPDDLAQQITMKTAECDDIAAVETTDAAGSPQDFIIEINNKSLTNRPDLWGHFGMAREIAAFTGLGLEDTVGPLLATTPKPPIALVSDDPEVCYRYGTALLEVSGAKVSPPWIRERLQALGLVPRSLVVDVTNLVMMELGHPTHAFDADKLSAQLEVRHATEGETFQALNGSSYRLAAADIVVASEGSPVGLAGIIGGASSAVSQTTTRVLIECAVFPASAVRNTSARLKLRTEASMRFEKGLDAENTPRALARIVALLQESGGARLVACGDHSLRSFEQPQIRLNVDWAELRLGRPLTSEQVITLLRGLRFGVEQTAERDLLVTVPTWRATKDVSLPEDLLEEIGRMVGYNSIIPEAPLVPIAPPIANPMRVQLKRFKSQLRTLGFTEVSGYSFLTDELIAEFGYESEDLLRVANPITSDQNFLRPSLVAGALKNVRENARYLPAFRFFEVGRVYTPGVGESKVAEEDHLLAVVYGAAKDGTQLLELTKIAGILVSGVAFKPEKTVSSVQHPSRSASVYAGENKVGTLFEVRPALLEKGRAAMLQLNLSALRALSTAEHRYQSPRRFPTSHFDLSVVTGAHTYAATIEAVLHKAHCEVLLRTEYLGAFALSPEEKSVSFRITLGRNDGTLTSTEISACHEQMITALAAAGYRLR